MKTFLRLTYFVSFFEILIFAVGLGISLCVPESAWSDGWTPLRVAGITAMATFPIWFIVAMLAWADGAFDD